MSRPTRTFIAVPLPAAQAEALGRLQRRLADDLPGARWVEPRHMHVTLAFLGDVEDADLVAVCRASAEAAAGFGPFNLRLVGLGAFPNPRRPRTVWVGLTGDVSPLTDLQKALVRTLTGVGHRPEDDRFHAHVSLARIKPGRGPSPDLSALIDRQREFDAGAFRADSVVTFASNLTPDGPEYTRLSTARLSGKMPGPAAPSS